MTAPFRLILCLTLALASRGVGTAAEPALKASLGSAFTVPGEETHLALVLHSETRPDQPPAAPPIPDTTVRMVQEGLRQSNRESKYLYLYAVRSYKEGVHTIPSFETSINGRKVRSQPVRLHVAPLPPDSWKSLSILGREIQYASAIFIPDRPPFEGETVPAEVKVYVPGSIAVEDATLAELEQDGVVAWRFEAVGGTGTSVRLRNKEHVGIVYRSTLSPIRSGEVTLGPGQASLTLSARITERGTILRQNVPATFEVPGRSFMARPLPPDPPEGFEGAVGRFVATATADTTRLEEGDPISVRLAVSGVGNLDTLPPPRLQSSDAEWKSYEPSRLERQGERRDVSGVVTFSQIIRPLIPQREVPPFRLVYFDPLLEKYETSRTLPIAYSLLPSVSPGALATAPLPNVATPVENMQGILGIVDPLRARPGPDPGRWRHAWQLVPALAALVMLGFITRRRLLPHLRAPQHRLDLHKALREVREAGPARREFLRAAGSFVESWIPEDRRDPSIRQLLERRDSECYRPGADDGEIPPPERSRIVEGLRTAARAGLRVVVAASLALLVSRAEAALSPESYYQQADAAWSEGSYRAAIEFYRAAHHDEPLPADVLFNIGNCYYRLQEPGLAALHYHRALDLDPRHPEARQNLRFLKRTVGSITIVRPRHQQWLATFPRRRFTTTLVGGAWVTILGILALLAFSGRPWRVLAWTALVAGPLTAIAGGTALYLYPGDAEFAPPESRAIVITSKPTSARTEAGHVRIQLHGEEAREVIPVPPGSVCRVLARRGSWVYVEFANQSRGWLAADELDTIAPSSTPSPPHSAPLGA